MAHGASPFVSGTYPIWRDVTAYGASGRGDVDDTAAINRAIADGERCGQACGSSSVKGAVIYFPPGTYLVSGSIIQLYYTQFIGDPLNPPTIKASSAFIGLGVVSSNVYIEGGNGASWYINQSNFLRQIRNFIIDITDIAQGTSLQNIRMVSSSAAGTNHQGIFMENGSGGMMYDLTFVGGNLGLYAGNQQFTTRNLVFQGCREAVQVHWDWGWTWKSLDIQNCGAGMRLTGVPGSTETGSVMLLDSKISNTPVGILISTPVSTPGMKTTTVNIDNLHLANVPIAVKNEDTGETVLAGGSIVVDSWGLGRVYKTDGAAQGVWQNGGPIESKPTKPAELLGSANGGFYERSKPQYESEPASRFVSIKFYGAKGDGVQNDAPFINTGLAEAATKNLIVFFPFGVYIVEDTINVPSGSKIVGEAWSQIMGKGAVFSDMSHPHVMVRVGASGETGSVEISDLMLTATGPTAGIILMEWNLAGSSPGAASMWDTHFRLGGAVGSQLQVANCPKLTGSVNPNCIAGSLMLRLTSRSSAYLENIWAWVADHDLDIPAQTQIDIYVARGVLIESQKPTWLYGTASEHCVLYQYQTIGARNLFMATIQTESPYYQVAPPAPAPFTSALSVLPDDPKFAYCTAGSPTCAQSWGIRFIRSSGIFVYGAGLYSWFQEYGQACVPTNNCQQKMVETIGNSNVWIYNLVVKASIEMISPQGGTPILAADNQNGYAATILCWLGSSSGGIDDTAGEEHSSPDGERLSHSLRLALLKLPIYVLADWELFKMFHLGLQLALYVRYYP
ncbi:family 55 glycoside hydrolase [Bisporella sp. PMI_857]|nr:family 55 glycoside hydrolase [Bisporella sp. PMI_857]